MKIEITLRELVIAGMAFCLSFAGIGYLLAERQDLKEVVAVKSEALKISMGLTDISVKYLIQAKAEIEDLKVQVMEVKMRERVRVMNPKAPAYRIVKAVLMSSKSHRMDPRLVLMQIEQESSYEVMAKGDDGLSRGLMQMRPSASREVGLNWHRDVYDIEKNIEAGVAYLDLQRRRSPNIHNALWNYNGGGDPFYVERIQYRMKRAFGA